ncbi:hypothetical protein QFC22_001976 [Naganishia vaughanmartiniae]|uniref:Uncharacterized protein n=1 Tax=Naganishia vaughanmartiniae TaxID=1424756 RepID=A0ACC2XH03_9TREE|nr:hypothetical protein QFC22_001976 [Naganishia vaughanmartiniae]
MAPEVISKGRLYDTKADIWSFGITVLEMAYGEPPMSGQSAQSVFSAMNKGFEPPKLEGGDWSREMADFVTTCLQEDPESRPTAEELSKLKFIKSHAKTPLHHLNELLVNLEAWKNKGNQRISLAPGVGGASTDDSDDSFGTDGDDEDAWQFNTVTSRLEVEIGSGNGPMSLSDGVSTESISAETPSTYTNSSQNSATESMNAPRSLRRLFENNDGPQPNSFKFPFMNVDSSSTPSTFSRSGSFGQAGSTFSLPSNSANSTNASASTPTASTFAAASLNAGNKSEFNTIRLPTDDDSDEEDALPISGGSRYGSFGAGGHGDTMIPSQASYSNGNYNGFAAPRGDPGQGSRQSHNLAQIVIPGAEDTIKFGGSGGSIHIGQDLASSPDEASYGGHGFNGGSSSAFGSEAGFGFGSAVGFNSKWAMNSNSSPTTVKFLPGRHGNYSSDDPGVELNSSPSPPRATSRPGFRRAETENTNIMQHHLKTSSSMDPSADSTAPYYTSNEAFAFPSRPSSPFSQPQRDQSSARLFHNQQQQQKQYQQQYQHSNEHAMVLPSAPVSIEQGSGRSVSSGLTRMPYGTTSTGSNKMSEPPSRMVPMLDSASRPGMLRQASVAVMENTSGSSSRPGSTPTSPQPNTFSSRGQNAPANRIPHRHRSSKASLGSGDSGRSYSLANDRDHAYPLPQSGPSSSGSASMSRNRSQSTGGAESDVSSAAGGYGAVEPLLSATLDLKEALRVGTLHTAILLVSSFDELPSYPQPPRPIIDTGDFLPSAPMGPTTSAFRHFASVPSPLAATPPVASYPRSAITDANTMRKIPSSPTQSRGPQITSSPKQMSANWGRQNTFTSVDEDAIAPLDVMTLDDPDVLFDRLETSARDLTKWLRMMETSLDDILTPLPQPEGNQTKVDEDTLDMPPMYA